MTEVKIAPIFNQSEPGVWGAFLRIRRAAMRVNYNHEMTNEECEYAISEYQNAWRRRSHNFAFGAYCDGQLVGFVQGDCVQNVATIRGLYVLPEFQSSRIGEKLLRHGEKAGAYGARSLDLVLLGYALNFYKKYGYRPLYSGSNEFVKKISLAPACEAFPVFKPTAKIKNACATILHRANEKNEPFNPSVDKGPIFVYLDINSNIQAYAIGGAPNKENQFEIAQFYVAKYQPTEFIRGCLNRAFENAAALHSIINQKSK